MEKNPSDLVEKLQLKLSDPVEYVRKIAERTTQKIVEVFTDPPIETINAIRFGVFMILNTIYARPEEDTLTNINLVNIVSQTTSQQINLKVDFIEFYQKTDSTTKDIALGDNETRKKFEEFLKTLIAPVS